METDPWILTIELKLPSIVGQNGVDWKLNKDDGEKFSLC